MKIASIELILQGALSLMPIVAHVIFVVATISAFVNILMLTGPLFMLQVYDRVLTSGSFPTLYVLLGLVAVLYGFMAVLDWMRIRLMSRVAHLVETRLEGPEKYHGLLMASDGRWQLPDSL